MYDYFITKMAIFSFMSDNDDNSFIHFVLSRLSFHEHVSVCPKNVVIDFAEVLPEECAIY